MKSRQACELSLHNFGYIEKNLTQLDIPLIPLTVPTLDDNILINCEKLSEPRAIVVEVDALCRSILVRRRDENAMQVMQADRRRDTYAHLLFRDPLEHIMLSKVENYTWLVNTHDDNVNDKYMLREFVGILSTFALSKQVKIKQS
ncbi:hypothetical protein KC953_02025 [Candidatus Saccharibacteria bacterium]|nr:hypothetical protein [Candidatus Saccharibacteria bacterium]